MKNILFVLALALLSVGCSSVKQTCDKVSNDSWKSFYSPTGTVGIHKSVNPCSIEVVGEPLDGYVVVGSDQANSVRLIRDGWDAMMLVGDGGVNGLHVKNDMVRFTLSGSLYEMTIDGFVFSSTPFNAGRCVKEGLVCRDDGVYFESSDVRMPAKYPRDATRANGLVYVADTFGHRVAVFSSKGRLVDSFEVFFPNSVQVVGRKLIVAAEHQNQILEIDLDTRERRILFGCDLDVYADPNLTVEQVRAFESSGAAWRADRRGICEGRLYSPNHATLYDDGTLLIADTDNHRVLVVRDGEIKTEIRNLNNPTRAAFWRAGKNESR